jgi:hypothetical protein
MSKRHLEREAPRLMIFKKSRPVPSRQLLVVSLLGLCAAPWLNAQANRCAIAGRVVDSSGAILQGAQIRLMPKEVDIASDSQGEFGYTDLVPGNYEIDVSYVGFEADHLNVACKEGEVAHVESKMRVTSPTEQILVTAERAHGETEAINRTRTADNILQVLPAEVITSLPNANVADALGRLPSVTLERIEGEGVYIQVRGTEPRLTNVTIDGITTPSPEPDVRQIRLDVIPADLVESVEINKTLEPDMDGDGIGGSVNLKTKTAGEFPTLNLFGIGGYNPILGGRANDSSAALSAIDSERPRNWAFCSVELTITTAAASIIYSPLSTLMRHSAM